MEKAFKFRQRQDPSRRAGQQFRPSVSPVLWFLIFGAAWALYQFPPDGSGSLLRLPRTGSDSSVAASFSICGSFRRGNCVIDGDTFDYQGERIRIIDIDAPETHPPRCAHEALLGAQATERLRELLNEGPFVMGWGDRDEDQYGRKLRMVRRNGRSLGAILVSEGLAREWTGHRLPWCG